MGKYNSLSELFTATAEAIRAKTGNTGTIVAEDFPTEIEGLSVGDTGTFKIVGGTITPAEETTEIIVEHNLGVVPKLAFMYISGGVTYPHIACAWCIDGFTKGSLRQTGNSMTYLDTVADNDITTGAADYASCIGNATETHFSALAASLLTFKFKANKYYWYVGG